MDGWRAWRLRGLEKVSVVFDPAAQAGLGAGQVMLWTMDAQGEEQRVYAADLVRSRLVGLSASEQLSVLARYGQWSRGQGKRPTGTGSVRCFSCHDGWVRGEQSKCGICHWERCPTCRSCGCGYARGQRLREGARVT